MKTRKTEQQVEQEDRQRYRKALGHYLKSLRKSAGKTQLALAEEIGFGYYTMISQVEAGTAPVPPARIAAWAKAVGVEASQIAHRVLLSMEPRLYDTIFGDVWVSRMEMDVFVGN